MTSLHGVSASLILVSAFGIAPACSSTQPAGGTVVQERLVVSATVPDSVPADILDNLDPEFQVPPDVLGVTFEPGLTRERKAEILSGVGAVEIIGGMPFPLLDGIYLVRIRTGNDMGLLIAARDALNEFDEVVSASLYSLLGRD